ncbi:MAG: hypothetical protein JSU86_00095 [Phycisphaerales bacterium]|nr:MAG: hypothetical protein JSU86_00095 [Phycisphaerales bacterium]
MLKICVVASAGGHLSQILRLAESYRHRPHFFVTTGHMVTGELGERAKVYVVPEANRQNPLRLLKIVYTAIRLMVSEQPNVVISTGAAPGCLFCLIGKLLRARVIWIDSLANVERMSLSGRIVSPFADLLLVQWPHLVKRYRRVEFAGNVL